MRIAIDTNIIYNDFKLQGAQFKIFFDGIESIPATLHIPQLVIDESVNKYYTLLQESSDSLESLINSFQKKLGLSIRTEKINVGVELKNYREYLSSFLVNKKAEIIRYPQVDHEKIVRRIFAKKLPFRKGESGYRDYLIWESIKELGLWGHEKVVFITNNAKDFGDGECISVDFEDTLQHVENFSICRSIAKFNEHYIIPRLKKLENLKADLAKHKLDKFDFQNWLNNNLVHNLNDFSFTLHDVLLGIPEDAGSSYITEVSLYKDYKIIKAVELISGEKLITYEVECDVDIHLDLSPEDYIRFEDVRRFLEDVDSPTYSFGYETVNLKVQGVLIFTKNGFDVVSDEIKFLQGPYGNVEL